MPERQLYRLFDVSVGQRLGIGFVVLALVVIALVLAAFYSQHRDAGQQQALRENAVLMARSVDDLGQSILAGTAALHTFALAPTASNRLQVTDLTARIRQAAEGLAGNRDDAVDPALRRFQATLSDQLDRLEALVAHIAADPSAHADGQAVTDLAVAMADTVLGFDRVQADRAADALDSANRLQTRATRSLLWGGLLILAIACGFVLLVLLSIRQPARSLLSVAKALAAGDRRPALALKRWAESGLVARRNEILLLGKAFGDAADAIDRRERRLSADGRVARATAAGFDREHMASAALAAIADGLHAEAGVIYVASSARQPLQAVASYGLSGERLDIGPCLALVEQARTRRERVVVEELAGDGGKSDTPRDPPPASHAGTVLRSAIAMPLMFQDRLHGVLLLVSRNRFDDDWLAFVEPAVLQLAIGFENIATYQRAQRLLDEVRERNEKIQNQNRLLLSNKKTLEQQNLRLQQQSDALAEADQRKNQFLSALAHELRNPMAALSAGLEVLNQRGTDTAQSRSALAVALRQSTQLGRLVDDLLDITRISRGKIVLRNERVDLAAIVRACVDDNRSRIQAKALHLELDLPSQPLLVDGDPARLRQIVDNLLANAIKFTGQDGQIAVQAQVADGDAQQLELGIQDDGIGMSSELIGRLFQPFSQGVLPLDRSSGGLGLGLALVKSLVELHGGSVQAESAGEGRGSRFQVRLPRVIPVADPGSGQSLATQGAAQAAGPVAAVSAAAAALNDDLAPVGVATAPRADSGHAGQAGNDGAGPGKPNDAGLRIVIIDDNADVGHMLATMVALDGHQVSNAHSGPEGLALMARVMPDLVLCDIGLPVMDGYEVARQVRADPQLQDIPMVAVSGYAMPRDRRMALDAGFDRHESKPLTLERFRAVVSVLAPRPAA